ncbi:ATP-binding protein [Geobacter sp. DSM 9736]|uniref:sensor histidine kinase n=1 Tax=Geobacter sp. DSM 9736 TaxID=1277350 RepID=UPI000B514532|nr:ATP-binding protein [Geobacter sp. DSM 9736]SNB44699.1 PAS domain S-box-containing protein [Geobacter sp. DSM 9736]
MSGQIEEQAKKGEFLLPAALMVVTLSLLAVEVAGMLSHQPNAFPLARGSSFRTLMLLVQGGLVAVAWRLAVRTRRCRRELEEARLRSEEEQGKVTAILDAMVDPVSVQDTDFRIIYQNAAHRNLMGDHRGEHCYRAYRGNAEICPECHLEQTFRDGKPHFHEASLEKGEATIFLEILSSPLRDRTGKIVAGIEAIRDITPRKQAEDEIRKLNRDLERQALNLAATNRELEAFSYSASHDLRTPLTRIYTAGQALEEAYLGVLDDNGRFFVRTICDAAEHMEELIEALLSLSQVASSEMTVEQVDLVPIALEIAADLQAGGDRSVEFVLPEGLQAMGDRQLLTVLLENLLGNAWKYTSHAIAPRVELGAGMRDGVPCYFVRDNGAGFDMKDADQLFKPFKRLHSSADFPGTGVGLATVQRIVQRHGGEVWAEGEPGKGATFCFTLRSFALPVAANG